MGIVRTVGHYLNDNQERLRFFPTTTIDAYQQPANHWHHGWPQVFGGVDAPRNHRSLIIVAGY